ncbi:protein kinase, partial [Tribonema minus]
MIRANDQMRKMAQREVAICRELAAHDPQCRKHCILMLASLEHKNHVVMVFESMQMNLRETLKKFGRRVGINVRAVRTYAHQLFVALRHLAARRVIHADIKPDNILVSQGFGCLKLADFGSAFHETDSDLDPTPYLVSRWYRAPEIILGLEYDRAIDTWSVAATLYELYMGASLFPGRDNNDMLAKMMELKGAFPPRMVKQHLRQFDKVAGLRPHFAEDLQFMLQEPDPITGKAKVRMTTPTAPTKTMRQLLLGGPHSSGEDRETVLHLADFLEKCLALDPKRRLTVADAFEHPFIK